MAVFSDIYDAPAQVAPLSWLTWGDDMPGIPVLTTTTLEVLLGAGFGVRVILDLRHNRHVTTFDERSETTFEPRLPRLYVDLWLSDEESSDVGWGTDLADEAAADLVFSYLNKSDKAGDRRRPLRLPVAGPHRSLFRLRPVPEALRNALQAVNASTAPRFNALPDGARTAMGLYEWLGGRQFVRLGGPDLTARVTV
ncbi:MAG: hypothetical protein AAFY03_10075 [Pseudomonadota bacterium]